MKSNIELMSVVHFDHLELPSSTDKNNRGEAMCYLLSIDQGTTKPRAILFERVLQPLAIARQKLAQSFLVLTSPCCSTHYRLPARALWPLRGHTTTQ